MSLFHQTDYREILKGELSTRLISNRPYSLRAFARDLQLSAATISHVLSGRKGLSVATAHKIAQSLGLNHLETEYFCALVAAETARSETERKQAQKTIKEYHREGLETSRAIELQLDAFRVISEWYHLPIIELFKTNPKLKPRMISKRLQISEIEISLAIGRLQRLGLIEHLSSGYRIPKELLFVKDNVPSDAIKKFHAQILEKAKNALIAQSIDERYFRSVCFPLKVKNIDKAQHDIKTFFEDFLAKHSVPEGDEIYSLSTQLFRLTEPEVK